VIGWKKSKKKLVETKKEKKTSKKAAKGGTSRVCVVWEKGGRLRKKQTLLEGAGEKRGRKTGARGEKDTPMREEEMGEIKKPVFWCFA